MANRVFSRYFGKLKQVFHWLSGFISEREIWLKINSPLCCLCTMPLTVYIALFVHYLMPSSQLSEERRQMVSSSFYRCETGLEANLSRANLWSCTPTQARLPPHPPTSHAVAGGHWGWLAVCGIFLWKAAWRRGRPLPSSFLFFGASCSKYDSAYQLLNKAENHSCLFPIIVFK